MFRVIIVVHKGTLYDALKHLSTLIINTITSSLLISHGVRKNTTLHIFFNEDEINLTFIGSQIRQLRPDEQSVKGILRKVKLVLEKRRVNRRSYRVHAGVIMNRAPLDKLPSSSFKSYGNVLKLKNNFKQGLDIRTINFNRYNSLLFITPLRPVDEQLLKFMDKDLLNVKVSRTLLNAPQLIILFHNEVDRHVYKSRVY